MLDTINNLFQFDKNALNIYSKRQEIIASNIANVDTPGYKAVDINFNYEMNKRLQQNNAESKKTSSKDSNHNENNISLFTILPIKSSELKKNGNTVNIHQERIKFIENSLKYQSSLVFLNYKIKNIMYVLKG